MLRMTTVRLFLALPVLIGLSTALRADSDWIRPGSFIEWPESLKESPPSATDEVAERPVIQTEFTQHEQVVADTLKFEEAEPPLMLQLTSTQLDQVSNYTWQVLPQGLLYHSYLAGEKESRTAATWLWEKKRGLIWEAAVGGRWGLLRHGTQGPNADGFQFDVEGGALVRIDPEEESDLEAADFRAGFLGTWRRGPWRWKAGYSHLSSHVGDEYLLKNPTYVRQNYVRDSLLVGVTYDITPELQGYGEIAYAANANGGAQPIELQFGTQYSPALETGFRGAPFAAINGHLRQELNFGGSVNVEAGWAWRGGASNHLFRAGFQHYNGNSMQWSFVHRYESLTGMGIWFDY